MNKRRRWKAKRRRALRSRRYRIRMRWSPTGTIPMRFLGRALVQNILADIYLVEDGSDNPTKVLYYDAADSDTCLGYGTYSKS